MLNWSTMTLWWKMFFFWKVSTKHSMLSNRRPGTSTKMLCQCLSKYLVRCYVVKVRYCAARAVFLKSGGLLLERQEYKRPVTSWVLSLPHFHTRFFSLLDATTRHRTLNCWDIEQQVGAPAVDFCQDAWEQAKAQHGGQDNPGVFGPPKCYSILEVGHFRVQWIGYNQGSGIQCIG